MTCEHCRKDVPEAVFCTSCGAHQGATGETGDPRTRTHAFAAHPGEHVAQPSVFSTLLPHIGSAKVHEFRWAFLIGLAVLTLLTATGLVAAALLGAVFLVPVLYLVYIYEAQVYRDEPASVIGFTVGGGIVLGVIATVVVDALFSSQQRVVSMGSILGLSVLLPLIQVVVMPLPALLLRGRAKFAPTVDGLVFGVAAGLGFALAESIVRFSQVITGLGFSTSSAQWIFPLISTAVLIPLLHGSAAGAVTAGLWSTSRTGRAKALGPVAIAGAAVLSVAFYLGAQLLSDAGVAALTVLGFELIPVGLLLIAIRYLLHYTLLEEATEMDLTQTVCSNCRKYIIAGGFCPSCGTALSATPRREPVIAAAVATAEA